MKEDSSLPKTAGPQVQDGALSPRERAIADYAAQEAREMAITQCAELAGRLATNASQLRLHAGEMSLQELRTAQAVLILAAFQIRALAAAPVEATEEQGSTRSGEEHLSPPPRSD